MGGIGSGRTWHPGAKMTTEDYLTLDVRHLKREGLLEPYQSFNWQWLRNNQPHASIRIRTEPDRVILAYRYNGMDQSYPVYLDWTACHMGGKRPWFLCPVNGCGRRVAILYGGSIFACRHCLQLAYASQREHPDERALRKADRIRAQLGWKPGIANGNGWKPQGMHWKTFDRLVAQHNALVQKSLHGTIKRLNLAMPITDFE